jgi:ankyrin repeat protein
MMMMMMSILTSPSPLLPALSIHILLTFHLLLLPSLCSLYPYYPFSIGITALHAAVQNDQYEVCEILLQTATKASRSAGTVICNLVDHNQDSPTHIACREGKHELLEVLLHHGGDTTLRDGKGYTVLHLACIGGM